MVVLIKSLKGHKIGQYVKQILCRHSISNNLCLIDQFSSQSGNKCVLTVFAKLTLELGQIYFAGIFTELIQGCHGPFVLKVALQIVGRKFYKNTEKSSIYSQSLLIFFHKTPVVESHPTTREITDLLQPRSTPMGNTVYFYMTSSLIYILKIRRRSLKQHPMKTLWKIITCFLCYKI